MTFLWILTTQFIVGFIFMMRYEKSIQKVLYEERGFDEASRDFAESYWPIVAILSNIIGLGIMLLFGFITLWLNKVKNKIRLILLAIKATRAVNSIFKAANKRNGKRRGDSGYVEPISLRKLLSSRSKGRHSSVE